RKLERLTRRREQLGPVNPLAEREYEEGRARLDDLRRQRDDLETALAETEKLIRDTDRKIRADFEETFEATERNFQELIEHLFPGGRGNLRLVDAPPPRAVQAATNGDGPPPESESSDEERSGEEADDDEDRQGVEIEV